VGDGDDPARLDQAEVGRILREESGRSVATLTGVFGDIDLAEDAVQEAFAVALHKWPVDGLPPNPGGWITTTARNRAIDRLRRESRGRELLGEVAALSPGDQEPDMAEETGAVPDDRLRLLTDGVGSHQHGRDDPGSSRLSLALRLRHRAIRRVQLEAGGERNAIPDGAGDRAAVGVEAEYPLDCRPLLLVTDDGLVDHQLVGDVDAPDHQHLGVQLDLADRVCLETTVSGRDAARLQRAPEGPGQSPGGRGHQVVQGGGVRLLVARSVP
jgi:Sigma-70 region 2